MYSNGILERQNQELNLLKLAAMRQLYSDAKFLFNIKFIGCTILVILANLISIFKTQHDFIQCSFLFIKIILVIVPFITFDKWIHNKRELAAIIQEEFDNEVLLTNWNDKKYGAKGIHNTEISNYSSKYAEKFLKDGWKVDLKNWYDIQYSQLPLNAGRISCQATNINWDKELRTKFNKTIYISLGIIFTILFIVFAILNIRFLELLEYGLLPFAPIIIFLVQTIKENNNTLSTLQDLRCQLDMAIVSKDNPNTTDEDLENLSNSLQEKIFEHRKNAFTIPDRFYSHYKEKQENLSKNLASIEKEQYEISKSEK